MAKKHSFASDFLNEEMKKEGANARGAKVPARGYRITSHEKQQSPRPANMSSHHPEWQSSQRKAIAGYNGQKDTALLLKNEQHKQITKIQRDQKAANPNHDKELGTSKSLMRELKNLIKAGVPKRIAGQTIIEKDGYAKGTTPLDKVKSTIRDWKKANAKASTKAPASIKATSRPGISSATKSTTPKSFNSGVRQ